MFLTPIELVDKQIDINTGGFFYAAKGITNQKHVEKIEKWAQSIFAKKGRKYINHPSRVMGLTALHVAVIAGKPLAVKLFLRLGARLSVQDSRGWTPMHHAAMQEDDAILRMLERSQQAKEAGKIKNIYYGATWKELRRLAFPESQKPADDAIVFHYENNEGEIVEGTTKDFKELTGAEFAYQMFASPEFFNHQWANPPRSQPSFPGQSLSVESLYHEPILNGYREFKKKPPTLYLKKTPVGHGVFAKEEIPNGTIVTAYLGEALIGENRSDYRMQKCDGEKVRNLGPMINDGLPNIATFSLDNLAGLPSLHLFRSMKKISPGDQLLFSYGEGHTVKYEKYINFAGKEAVIEEYKDSSLEKRIQLLKTFRERGDVIGLMSEFQMLDYLFSSPLLRLKLLLEGILSIDVLNDAKNFIPIETMRSNYKEFIDLPSRIAKVVWKVCDLAPDPQLAKLHLVSFLDHLSKELPQHFAILCFAEIIFQLHEEINKLETSPTQGLFDKKFFLPLIVQTILKLIRHKFTFENEKLITPEDALRRAASGGDLPSVTFLIENGIVEDPHSRDPRSGETALDIAIEKRQAKIEEYLRKCFVDKAL